MKQLFSYSPRSYLVTFSVLGAAATAAGACGSDSDKTGGDGGAGGATAACPAGQTLCDDGCVSLTSDADHCGSCNNTCSSQQACQAGACACAQGLTVCDGACVDLQADAGNCGECGTECSAEELCAQGACRPQSEGCPDGLEECEGACVNTQSSAQHCGACGDPCLGGQNCSAGVCECADGRSYCDDRCVDTDTDANNCGECGNQCPASQACDDGSCAETGTGGTGGTSGTGGGGGSGGSATGGGPGTVPKGEWARVADPGLTADTLTGAGPDIAVGDDEQPTIVLTRSGNENDDGPLVFSRFTGTAWVEAAPDVNAYTGAADHATDVGIEFDDANRLVTVLSERAGSSACDSKIRACRLEGGSWQGLGNTNCKNGGSALVDSKICGALDMAIDGNDIYVVWAENSAHVKRYSDGSWQQTSTVPKCSDGVVNSETTSIAVLAGGTPAVAYGTLKPDICTYKLDSGSWTMLDAWTPHSILFPGPLFRTSSIADGSSLVVLANGTSAGVQTWTVRYTSDERVVLGESQPRSATSVLLRTPDGAIVRVLGAANNIQATGWNGSSWEAIGDPITDAHTCTAGAVSPAGVLWLVCLDAATTTDDVSVYKLER